MRKNTFGMAAVASLLTLAPLTARAADEAASPTSTATTTAGSQSDPFNAYATASSEDPITTDDKRRLAVKVGGLWPTDSSARDIGNDALFSLGADVAVFSPTSDMRNSNLVYIDYQHGSHDGGNLEVLGGGFAVRSYQPIKRQGVAPYFGIGGGYYSVRTRPMGGGPQTTQYGWGAKAFAGIGIAGPIFAEVSYDLLPHENGVNPDGVTLQVGLRF